MEEYKTTNEINRELMKPNQSVVDSVIKKVMDYEQQFIKKVINQIVGRESTIEDGKDIIIAKSDKSNTKQGIYYKGIFMGELERFYYENTHTIPNYYINFTPFDDIEDSIFPELITKN